MSTINFGMFLSLSQRSGVFSLINLIHSLSHTKLPLKFLTSEDASARNRSAGASETGP
jgi:hypothetical protein